jgi:CHAT domain-containing protein/Tfp pilus assembly protein PilF
MKPIAAKYSHLFLKQSFAMLIGFGLCCQLIAGVQAGQTEAARLREKALSLQQAGKYDEALKLALGALALEENDSKANPSDVANSLLLAAEIYLDQGNNLNAEPLLERALSIREQTFGNEHPDVAVVLNDLALLCIRKGESWRAETFYRRALGIREKTLNPDHPDLALSLNNLAVLYDRRGEFWKAEPLYERALAIREKVLGQEHPHVALSLANLAGLYAKMDNPVKAEGLYQRALTIREKILGAGHPQIATLLNSLAILKDDRGAYDEAELFYRRALAIREKALPRDHRDLFLSRENLALLLVKKQDYQGAEALYGRAIEESRPKRGRSLVPYDVANWLSSLAYAYSRIKDDAQAEALYQRALAIREGTPGQHLGIPSILDSLGWFYLIRGKYAEAEACYQRAIAIYENLPGRKAELPRRLHKLGELYVRKGEFAKAEPLLQRSLDICEQSPDISYYTFIDILNTLANLYAAMGELTKAEEFYQRSLAVQEKEKDSGFLGTTLRAMGLLSLKKGDIGQAISLFTRLAEVSETGLTKSLGGGSELQKLSHIRNLTSETDDLLTLHTRYAPQNPDAWRLAMITILRRKGRALDAMTNTIKVLRGVAAPADQALLDRLDEVRAKLATATLEGFDQTDPAQHKALLKSLEKQIENLESTISERVAEFRSQGLPSQLLLAVTRAIPSEAILVEFATYRPLDVKTKTYAPARYLAYTLNAKSDSLWLDLGETRQIDQMIEEWRAALRDPKRTDVKALARTLDSRLMEPIRKLHSNRWLLISPDGALNLVPFGALVDEKNQYLIENYSFTYLTSGRDLLRMSTRISSRQPSVIISNPDFGKQNAPESPAASGQPPQKRQTHLFSNLYFPPLPGTQSEGEALSDLLPTATLLTERRANKAALSNITGPEILHIATHGFFLEDLKAPLPDPSSEDTNEIIVMRGIGLLSKKRPDAANPLKAMPAENPLLRSGLALAGANEYWRDGNSGILTAMEATGLYLWGTKLVVLSACDTGVGQIRNGEGVYGLRRALVLAGSESQVMSLWPVSDGATRTLMIDFYRALQKGEGRSEALRKAQLNLLRDSKWSHPAYWASFIQSGKWTSLSDTQPGAMK